MRKYSRDSVCEKFRAGLSALLVSAIVLFAGAIPGLSVDVACAESAAVSSAGGSSAAVSSAAVSSAAVSSAVASSAAASSAPAVATSAPATTPAPADTGGSIEGAGKNTGIYESTKLNASVWYGGQAALWDFDFIDYLYWFGHVGRYRGYKPEQPIRFSHITHVQKNQIECQFCHWSVAKSTYAAIPEVETCWGCHKNPTGVRGTTPGQQAEIKKIDTYWNEAKPIPWVKVHVMPDYVKFNHKRHVKAGVSCHNCHGQVPAMEQVERVSSMKMGWCVTCHREEGTSIDCATCHY